MNEGVLVSIHGYAGDAHQIKTIMPCVEHHQRPIIIVSPYDSPIPQELMVPHICRTAGKRAYIGQDSWDRQYYQMRMLLEEYPFDWYLMNDSDSFCLTPELPAYLFEDTNAIYSNQVTDFRIPGELTHGQLWPSDYHQGYPLIAMQPPYFCSRPALEKMVALGRRTACPITPFIDWAMVVYAVDAGLTHKPFLTGASCETETDMGRAVMAERVGKYGATFIHSVKRQDSFDNIALLYKQVNK